MPSAEADIAAIEAALQRLATGEYGICTRCDQPIDAQQLEVSPLSITRAQCKV
jgi:RNA polymerase-binding transcription factor DksA